MTDPIPESLRALDALERFEFEENAGQCAPGTTDFFTWLAHIKGASAPYCNESDAAVLELLYNASEGPDWTNSGGWLDTPVLKDWHGVEANPLGRVVALDLTANGLVGRSYVICHRPPGPLRMQWGKASELASRCCSVAASRTRRLGDDDGVHGNLRRPPAASRHSVRVSGCFGTAQSDAR